MTSGLTETAARAAGNATGTATEGLVVTLLGQLVVLLVVTRVVVWISRRFFGQTDAVGEMIAGVVLGPSVLGAVAPGLMARLFAPSTGPIFVGVSQVGLVFLMFQIGLEFELARELRKDKARVLVLSLVGIVAPFALGYVSAGLFHPRASSPTGRSRRKCRSRSSWARRCRSPRSPCWVASSWSSGSRRLERPRSRSARPP